MMSRRQAAGPRGRERPRLSIVIPVLDEEAALPGTLDSLAAQTGVPSLEIILADGGSDDRTIERFHAATRGWESRGWTARVLDCRVRGRAAQMNGGAAQAGGVILLFLHADTHLPPGALAAVVDALEDPAVVGGGFRLAFRESGLLLRAIAAFATLRSRARGIHYGDQAMFVRRSAFDAIGGFPRIPLFEDLRLSRALRRRGRVRTLPLAVGTSARRLRASGPVRAAGRFAWLKIRHALGADPQRLKADYPDVR
jgi:rSAM/selenodomain-associated transferase 2